MTKAKYNATMQCAGCGRMFSHVSHAHIVRCEALRAHGITSTVAYRAKYGVTVPAEFIAQAKRTIERFNVTTPRDERIENSRQGFAVAMERHPDLCRRGGLAGATGLWARPGQKERHTERLMKLNLAAAMTQEPNKLEQRYLDLIGEGVIEYASFRFWKTLRTERGFAHITPDFRVVGQMAVVEVYGDYWHAGDDPQQRIGQWESVGVRCLVVWEHEINREPERVKEMTAKFISGTPHECPAPAIDQAG